jgi:predicted metal-dependent hydrolase
VRAINLRGRIVEYSVVKGRSRRYTYLRFRDDEVLEVVAPNPRSLDAEATIRERQAWVLKHLERISRSVRVLTRDSVMFDGAKLRIVFEKTEGREGLEPDPARGEVTIRAPDRSSVRELVRRWFLKESSRYVVETLPSLAERLGVRYRRADVREIRNWGYCTRGGRLSFSWQLIALPARLREYVLCHELVHLSEQNHSGAFRRKLGSILPDYKRRERELDSTIPL